MAVTPITITNAAIADVLGEARFSSVTFRLFKLPKGLLETSSEDYGQFATYKGTIPRCSHAYQLDAGHRFETGRAFAVCGNTAALVRARGRDRRALPALNIRCSVATSTVCWAGNDLA